MLYERDSLIRTQEKQQVTIKNRMISPLVECETIYNLKKKRLIDHFKGPTWFWIPQIFLRKNQKSYQNKLCGQESKLQKL
jgi:hypothetical protein